MIDRSKFEFPSDPPFMKLYSRFKFKGASESEV